MKTLRQALTLFQSQVRALKQAEKATGNSGGGKDGVEIEKHEWTPAELLCHDIYFSKLPNQSITVSNIYLFSQ